MRLCVAVCVSVSVSVSVCLCVESHVLTALTLLKEYVASSWVESTLPLLEYARASPLCGIFLSVLVCLELPVGSVARMGVCTFLRCDDFDLNVLCPFV